MTLRLIHNTAKTQMGRVDKTVRSSSETICLLISLILMKLEIFFITDLRIVIRNNYIVSGVCQENPKQPFEVGNCNGFVMDLCRTP